MTQVTQYGAGFGSYCGRLIFYLLAFETSLLHPIIESSQLFGRSFEFSQKLGLSNSLPPLRHCASLRSIANGGGGASIRRKRQSGIIRLCFSVLPQRTSHIRGTRCFSGVSVSR